VQLQFLTKMVGSLWKTQTQPIWHTFDQVRGFQIKDYAPICAWHFVTWLFTVLYIGIGVCGFVRICVMLHQFLQCQKVISWKLIYRITRFWRHDDIYALWGYCDINEFWGPAGLKDLIYIAGSPFCEISPGCIMFDSKILRHKWVFGVHRVKRIDVYRWISPSLRHTSILGSRAKKGWCVSQDLHFTEYQLCIMSILPSLRHSSSNGLTTS